MKEWSLKLQERRDQGLYRTRIYNRGGKQRLSFISNDYLGLADHPKVITAFKTGVDKYGIGNCSSPLLGGYSSAHQALEEELAEFIGYPRVLVFSSGYAANIGVMGALFPKKTHIFADRLNHASLVDGAIFCGAHLERYRHCDMQDLQKRLATANITNRLICSDGVFSMDGDVAPIKDLAVLAKQNDCILMIDDAHGIGIIGKNGKGALSLHNLSAADVPILVGTLSKAFGTFGGFVASSEIIIENLIQFSRSYVYSTSLPPAIAEASRASLKIIQQESWRREHLQKLINYFKTAANQLGLSLTKSQTQIQPVIVGSVWRGQKLYEQLRENGILVGLVRPPSVPVNTTRLRINFTTSHSFKQDDYLLDVLIKIMTDKKLNFL
jgi:8-amino-7-oxononanoate synthase